MQKKTKTEKWVATAAATWGSDTCYILEKKINWLKDGFSDTDSKAKGQAIYSFW